ncbi:hypothetical protein [Scleromatobacter humisilvae]|uniref:Uncharacterized protein n=1 Tax=Scleromatobacter humisilvae TaxID=2897159 RepID=A0A9X1YPD7_9BURK|nr:hypothetical protein [Scleromatobacter humisilvae]MCK9685371.1 hypothetical protein [Scleromatobacter humisilvae]
MSLQWSLPRRQPPVSAGYASLIRSLRDILASEPALRERAAWQGLCMAAFGLFWTSIALRLFQPPFGLGQRGIAVFSLAGATGVVVAPVAGWAGDKDWSRATTRLEHAAVPLALALAWVAGSPDAFFPWALPQSMRLPLMGLSAVLLDLGVIADVRCRRFLDERV